MNKSQSLALVAVGVIAVLLVTAMVADPQDAMASKKHKKHHHHDATGVHLPVAAGNSGGGVSSSGSLSPGRQPAGRWLVRCGVLREAVLQRKDGSQLEAQ